MAKLKGLGRGLDALLAGSDEMSGGESLQSLPLDRIGVGKYQPRTRMDEQSLAELALSIKAQGVMQPILCGRSTAAATRSSPASGAGAQRSARD
jgi:ParB family chromosome partitioning protein